MYQSWPLLRVFTKRKVFSVFRFSQWLVTFLPNLLVLSVNRTRMLFLFTLMISPCHSVLWIRMPMQLPS